MDLSLLETLKDKLINATEFADVMNYFFDHFGEDPEFFDQGERVSHSLLESILETVAEQLYGKKIPIGPLLLTRLPEYQFIHGGGSINGRPLTVIYFEDACKGLLAVIWSIRPSETKFVRFTGVPAPDHWKRSVN